MEATAGQIPGRSIGAVADRAGSAAVYAAEQGAAHPRKGGADFRLRLQHVAFNRAIGQFKGVHADPQGEVLTDAQWIARKNDYLPSTADGDFIASLMVAETEPGKFASWIAPPKAGIDNKPGDFEYVQLHMA